MTINRAIELQFQWERGARLEILKWITTFQKPCIRTVPFDTLEGDFLSVGWSDGLPEVCEHLITLLDNGSIYMSVDSGKTWFSIYDASSSGAIPSGTVVWWTKNTTPSGWLLADGSAINRITYANLFSAIGTAYGVGDGSTTFNIPDLRGRVIKGVNDANTGINGTYTTRSVGTSGGVEGHSLVVAEIYTHNHNFNYGSVDPDCVNAATRVFCTNAGGTTGVTGSSDPHNTIHPVRVLRPLIKE